MNVTITSLNLRLSSTIERETSGLLVWLAYHRSHGITTFDFWMQQSAIQNNSVLKALSEADLISLRVLEIDTGDDFESGAHALVLDAMAAPDQFHLMLHVDEYLELKGKKALAKRLLSDKTDFDVMPIKVQSAKNANTDVQQNIRSLFRGGLFINHNGSFPIKPTSKNIPVWIDSAGETIDTSNAFHSDQIRNSNTALTSIHKLPPETNNILKHPLFSTEEYLSCGRKTQIELEKLLKIPAIKSAWDALVMQESLDDPEEPVDTDVISEEPKTEIPVADKFDQVLTDPPPPWFIDIYPGGENQGFLKRLKNHALTYIERDPSTLVVTFDNLSSVNDRSLGRLPWGYKIIKELGHSHLGVMAMRKDWYRETSLIAEMQSLAQDGFFAKFDRVVMAGTSMGGFAALTFSSLAPGATILAMSPQSTLNEGIVPWETRFEIGRARNWRLAHSDAAFEIEDASKIYLISDPYEKLDQRHIDRLHGENIIHLKSWYSGHFSPVFLRRAEILKEVFMQAIDGSLNETSYYALYRARRNLPWYAKSLTKNLEDRNHPDLAKRVLPAFRKMRKK
jgi:hypothetical protein